MSLNNFKLHQITKDYEIAIDKILNSAEEDDTLLADIKDNFDHKAINVAKYIKNLEAEYDAIKKHAEEMIQRVKIAFTRMESLKLYLQYNIERTGLLDPIKCAEFDIKIVNNPPSLIIENPDILPDIYKVTKEVVTFDKAAIKKDIQSGLDIDGARIEKKRRLVIG